MIKSRKQLEGKNMEKAYCIYCRISTKYNFASFLVDIFTTFDAANAYLSRYLDGAENDHIDYYIKEVLLDEKEQKTLEP